MPRFAPRSRALLVLLCAGAVLGMALAAWMLLPRLWVRNRQSRLVFNGAVTDDFVLYHGTGSRILLFVNRSSARTDKGSPAMPPDRVYMLSPLSRQAASCEYPRSVNLRFIFLALGNFYCPAVVDAPPVINNRIAFVDAAGNQVEASWQNAPR